MLKDPDLIAALRASPPPRLDAESWVARRNVAGLALGWLFVGLPITAIVGIVGGAIGGSLGAPAWGAIHVACLATSAAVGAYLAHRLLARWYASVRNRMVARYRDGVLYDAAIDSTSYVYAPGAGLIRMAKAHFVVDGIECSIKFGAVSGLEVRDATVTVLFARGQKEGIAFDANGKRSYGHVVQLKART